MWVFRAHKPEQCLHAIDAFLAAARVVVEVELLEKSAAMDNTELGVLTWKLRLAPGEVKKLKLSYSVKYPKDKILNL